MRKRSIIIRLYADHLPFTIFYLYTVLSCSFLLSCSARDTITVNSWLNDGETLVSAEERFELGFFTPESDERFDFRRYVGIWYYKSHPPIVVWVANRDKPLSYSDGVLAIKDGNLMLLNSTGNVCWSTKLESSSLPANSVAKLLDSGNLVLSQDDPFATSLWQSFKHPSDTFLPGMKMDEKLSLTSWTSPDNPEPGNFTFKLDHEDNQYVIMKRVFSYWRTGKSGNFFSSEEMPDSIPYLLSNFSRSVNSTDSSSGYQNLTSNVSLDYSNMRLIMNNNGEIQLWRKDKMIWWEPENRCSVSNFCGNFGSCISNSRVQCKCLPGFVPKSPENWKSGDFSNGCTKKSSSCVAKEMFLSLKMMKFGSTYQPYTDKNETECLKECLNHCLCQAYSYVDFGNSSRRGETPRNATCLTWTEDLNNLQEGYMNGGHDLYVRVVASDIGSTERNCEPCGTNLIPYPLSTNTSCGDPKYFSFECNTSTGQVSFKALSSLYWVTQINPDTRRFSIQIKCVDNCDAKNSLPQLNQSLPFSMTTTTKLGQGKSSSNISYTDEVEIGWEPPPEPTCNSPIECKDWPHSTCNLTGSGERRCLCHKTFQWDGRRLNCTQEVGNEQEGDSNTKQVEGFYGRKKQPRTLIVAASIASVILLSGIIAYFYTRLKNVKRREGRERIRRNVKDLVDTGQFKEEDKEGIDLPFFDFESILAATDNFSEANQLGKGGFGPVYKGKFSDGRELAIKRLSSASGQGFEEFKNEVVLIARLQHRNLVRLLGYCVQGAEKILLYEYMPNKSLDFFIFDRTLSAVLDWEMRFSIILGIARGLLYLHQDSRLRIIHRDMKTSNILLDEEMNPKISDFGLARIFQGKQTEGTTNRVVGTYGYMSPEYALDGFFSVKSDVFSFGVVVLEIISGKKTTGFYNSIEAVSLLGYAWRLRQENKALEVMDQNLSASSKTDEILQCINVGLLCVQEHPNDRPTMSNVVVMLSSEAATLPTPKRPAFLLSREFSSTASSSSKPKSNTEITTTLEEVP